MTRKLKKRLFFFFSKWMKICIKIYGTHNTKKKKKYIKKNFFKFNI